MKRAVHSVLCAILIVGGATMVVSGWHGFAKDEPAALDAQDEGPRLDFEDFLQRYARTQRWNEFAPNRTK